MIIALSLIEHAPLMLGLALGAAGLAIAVVVWRNRRRRFLATHGPAFQRLCDGLGVSRFDRWRLARLASKAGLITPAALLISRGAFDNALVRAAVHPDSRWVTAFRQQMFTGGDAT